MSLWWIILSIIILGFLKFFSSLSLATRWWSQIKDHLFYHEYCFYRVPELNETTLQENSLYRRTCVYINSLPSLEDSDYANLLSGYRSNHITVRPDPCQLVKDSFLGADVWWRREEISIAGIRCDSLVLRLNKRDKGRVLRPYLRHVDATLTKIESEKGKEIRLFSTIGQPEVGGCRRWKAMPFKHPAKWDTFAMNDGLKVKLKADLEVFLKAKQYYNRVGRVWKRSYLLHGPAGTGKSSFAAVMAKLIGYDIYDVDLKQVTDESELKSLLLQTAPRSLVLIENLGRTLTVSGILAVMDGVWSGRAEGQVVVFTAANLDVIDPMMIRPGKIDVHVHFPFCDYRTFRTLADTCLGLKEHKLFNYVEEVFTRNGPKLSPGEMGDIMMVNRTSPSQALKTVISALEEHDNNKAGVGMEEPSLEMVESHRKRVRRKLVKLYRFIQRGDKKIDRD